MNTGVNKVLALAGLCALMVGAGGAAMAQGPFGGPDGMMHHHHGMHHAHHSLHRIHAAYARAKAHGNVEAEQRLHEHAKMIRHHVRDHGHFDHPGM